MNTQASSNHYANNDKLASARTGLPNKRARGTAPANRVTVVSYWVAVSIDRLNAFAVGQSTNQSESAIQMLS